MNLLASFLGVPLLRRLLHFFIGIDLCYYLKRCKFEMFLAVDEGDNSHLPVSMEPDGSAHHRFALRFQAALPWTHASSRTPLCPNLDWLGDDVIHRRRNPQLRPDWDSKCLMDFPIL